jgi:hypothetical protein
MLIDELNHRERVRVEGLLTSVRALQSRQQPQDFYPNLEQMKQLVDEEKLSEREKMALIELLIG